MLYSIGVEGIESKEVYFSHISSLRQLVQAQLSLHL